MNKSTEFSNPVFLPEPENQSIKRLDAMLDRATAKLVGIDGEEIFLPDSAYQVLRQVIHMMAQNRAIALVPYDHYLSSQEAADLLNISRPYLYKLLDESQLPFIMVGTHRRIRFEDLMDYKSRRDDRRNQALDELAVFSQELGFYADRENSNSETVQSIEENHQSL